MEWHSVAPIKNYPFIDFKDFTWIFLCIFLKFVFSTIKCLLTQLLEGAVKVIGAWISISGAQLTCISISIWYVHYTIEKMGRALLWIIENARNEFEAQAEALKCCWCYIRHTALIRFILEPCNLTLSNGSHTSTRLPPIYKHGEELKIQDKTKPSIF